MNVNNENMVSIKEAILDFSRVARMVDEKGSVVIFKNNSPRYLLIEFNQVQREQSVSDEDIIALSKRIIEKNRETYEVLAK